MRLILLVLFGAAFATSVIVSLWLSILWPPMILFSLLFAATLFEQVQYRAIEHRPSSDQGWRATRERFVDPESGALVTVWYQQSSGERRYVAADDVPPN